MGVGGTEGMPTFYDTCLATLYPPGQCTDVCTPTMMHCKLMEVQASCCSDPTNCPTGQVTPNTCPVECALVFPGFFSDCHDALVASVDGASITQYQSFVNSCIHLDTTALVEYAIDLASQGCLIPLSTVPVVAPEPEPAPPPVECSPVQADLVSRCIANCDSCDAGMAADILVGCAIAGVAQERGVTFCHGGHRRAQGAAGPPPPPSPYGGMAKWADTPAACPWNHIDERIREVNDICCGHTPAEADAVCPNGAPPRACSAACAVAFHAMSTECGTTLSNLAGDFNSLAFTDFDAQCTSTQTVDPVAFLDAISNAVCVQCPEILTAITDGSGTAITISTSKGFAETSVASYICADTGGPPLHGPTSSTCQHDGTWGAPVPTECAFVEETFDSAGWNGHLVQGPAAGGTPWTNGNSGTPSSSTGPDGDSPSDAGNSYIFTEASSHTNDDFTLNVVPYFPAGTSARIDFWYQPVRGDRSRY
jgi:hypothetical protein